MSLFGGILSIKTINFLILCVFLIIGVGYLLGKITVDDISLGTAGVFIIALLFGAIWYAPLAEQLQAVGGALHDNKVTYVREALKIIETLGLILFVTSVGFIAGPGFFEDLKKNFRSYIVLGLVIILLGGVSCALCIIFDYKVFPNNVVKHIVDGQVIQTTSPKSLKEVTAMLVGLLSGSLTSTPAFSASKSTIMSENLANPALSKQLEDIVTVGHGIAYLFGVVGVVLFVQLVPKLEKANMEEERRKMSGEKETKHDKLTGKEVDLDPFGFCVFSIIAFIGIVIGSFKFGHFSLTTTGGCLIAALIAGHFEKIGKVSIMPHMATLKVFREVGLVFFLIGAGVAGGASFVLYFRPVYFIYGIVMTLLPLVIGYFFAKYLLRMNLLNNLGSICGGMTSTPALGTLIHTAGTENVGSAYASTYPIALIAVVIVSQILILIFK